MNTDSNIARSSKKNAWLGNPSTTILRRLDFRRIGAFAVIGGPKIGLAFSLNQDKELIIGSGSKADIQIDGRGISRKHCFVFWKNNELYIEDLKSTNGTKVNKRKIKSPTKLDTCDQIEIGATTVIKCS